MINTSYDGLKVLRLREAQEIVFTNLPTSYEYLHMLTAFMGGGFGWFAGGTVGSTFDYLTGRCGEFLCESPLALTAAAVSGVAGGVFTFAVTVYYENSEKKAYHRALAALRTEVFSSKICLYQTIPYSKEIASALNETTEKVRKEIVSRLSPAQLVGVKNHLTNKKIIALINQEIEKIPEDVLNVFTRKDQPLTENYRIEQEKTVLKELLTSITSENIDVEWRSNFQKVLDSCKELFRSSYSEIINEYLIENMTESNVKKMYLFAKNQKFEKLELTCERYAKEIEANQAIGKFFETKE